MRKDLVRWISSTVTASLLLAGQVAGRQTDPKSQDQTGRVRVLAVGGFLGQLDGFCEHPGGTYDLAPNGVPFVAPFCAPGGPGGQTTGPQPPGRWPFALGGLLGAAEWIASQDSTALPPVILVPGNNQLADFADQTIPRSWAATASSTRKLRSQDAQGGADRFWTLLRDRLKPTVVGLGPEDFLRSLRTPPRDKERGDLQGDRVRFLVDWIRSGGGAAVGGLPFLASNAVVKIEGDELNKIEDGDYTLEVEEGESVAWVQKVKLEHPAGVAPVLVLEESDRPFSGPGARRTVPITTSAGPAAGAKQHTTVTALEGSLLPGKYYQLQITATGRVRHLTFRTHETLLPRSLAADPWVGPAGQIRSRAADHLKGFPVVLTPTGTGEDLVVISLVDPATGLGLGKNAWTYRNTTSALTIAFTSPSDAVAAILRRLAAADTKAPYVVLLSSLNDDDTLEIMETFPEIRVAVLPPESHLLGRASRLTVNDPSDLVSSVFSRRHQPSGAPAQYGGDLGLASIVNRHEPPATRVLARPEWIGETGTRVDVTMKRNQYDEWETHDPDVSVQTLPGAALTYQVRNGLLYYWPVGHPSLELGPYLPYLSTPISGASGNDLNFIKLWTEKRAFAAAAGEAVRNGLNGDVAIVPDDLFDDDALGWLNHALQSGDTGWLSRFVLERAMFRSYRFVRADVQGSELLDKLTKALSDPLETGAKACVVGLGAAGCPATIDKEHPERMRIRDRAIVSSVFYNVVLADSVAEKLELKHDDKITDSEDALDMLDRFLTNHLWEATSPLRLPALPVVVEHRAQNETRHYLKLSALELGFGRIFVNEPDEREGVLPNLPVDFKGAKPERTLTGKIDADWAIWESRLHAGRVLATVDFSERTEFKKETKEITNPRDAFSIGGRLEGRLIDGSDAIETRPYIGVFLEGPLRPTSLTLTATREREVERAGFKLSESAGFSTPLTLEPSRFAYAAIGADFLPAAADLIPSDKYLVKPTRLGVDLGYGRLSSVLVGLTLGSEPQEVSRFLASGAKTLLNEYFAKNAATFDQNVEWFSDSQNRQQWRIRVTADGDVGVKMKTKTYKATLQFQYSRFRMDQREELALSWNMKFTSKFTLPLFWRFELVPTYEFQWAAINADENNRFGIHRFEFRANVPWFIRFGKGRFVQ